MIKIIITVMGFSLTAYDSGVDYKKTIVYEWSSI